MKVLDNCEYGNVAGLCSGCESFIEKGEVASFKCKVHGDVLFYPEVEGFEVTMNNVRKNGKIILNMDEECNGEIRARPVHGNDAALNAYLFAIGDKVCASKYATYYRSTVRTEYYNMLRKIGKHLKKKKSVKIVGVTNDLRYILSDGTKVGDVKC